MPTTTTKKKTTSAKASSEAALRRLLVITEDGERKIVENVPANAKVTFGTIHAGKEAGFHERRYALRVYTSESNQLAVFTGVREFRDLSLDVKVEKKNRSQVTTETQDSTDYRGTTGFIESKAYVSDNPAF